MWLQIDIHVRMSSVLPVEILHEPQITTLLVCKRTVELESRMLTHLIR